MGKVTIYLPDDTERVAREALGNVSQVCRAAIESEIEMLAQGTVARERLIAMQLRLLAERLEGAR